MNKKVTEKVNYYQNLDLLRFFLALSVVIYHIPEITFSVLHVKLFNDLPIFHKGSEAVFCFFTLSGYLITRLLLVEKRVFNDVNLKMFYLRRVLRIWPVYFTVITIGLIYYHVLLPKFGIVSKDNYKVTTAILLCVFFLSNIFQKMFSPGSILSITWSIGVEEQFYLVWPLIFKNLTVKTILFSLIFMYVFIVSYNIIYPGSLLLKYRFLFDFMIIGGIASILINISDGKVQSLFTSNLLRILFGLMFIGLFFTDILSPIRVFNEQLYNSISGLVSIGFIAIISYLPPVNLFNRFTYFGKISYGIYMYHMIIVNFVLFLALKLKLEHSMQPGLLSIVINVLVILITMLVAHISYKYFETYFLSLKDKFTKVKPSSV